MLACFDNEPLGITSHFIRQHLPCQGLTASPLNILHGQQSQVNSFTLLTNSGVQERGQGPPMTFKFIVFKLVHNLLYYCSSIYYQTIQTK